jgi:hypothetical protein
MKAVAAILILVLAAGCTEEIRRGDIRPDGSQFAARPATPEPKDSPSASEGWWRSLFRKPREKPPERPTGPAAGIHRGAPGSNQPDKDKVGSSGASSGK